MGRVKVAKLPRCFSQCAEVILKLLKVRVILRSRHIQN